ncbi:hypothetical protein ACLB6G_05730 [Zhengella sp. ZM62]|uniref:hypothetical protein n=1 Tax=Zhengella sedimenti TaxID=3390035 RepID=UPI00397482E7
MSGLDHESTVQIDEAARWLARLPNRERKALSPIVPALKARFGFTAGEACAAIREANLIQGRAP